MDDQPVQKVEQIEQNTQREHDVQREQEEKEQKERQILYSAWGDRSSKYISPYSRHFNSAVHKPILKVNTNSHTSGSQDSTQGQSEVGSVNQSRYHPYAPQHDQQASSANLLNEQQGRRVSSHNQLSFPSAANNTAYQLQTQQSHRHAQQRAQLILRSETDTSTEPTYRQLRWTPTERMYPDKDTAARDEMKKESRHQMQHSATTRNNKPRTSRNNGAQLRDREHNLLASSEITQNSSRANPHDHQSPNQSTVQTAIEDHSDQESDQESAPMRSWAGKDVLQIPSNPANHLNKTDDAPFKRGQIEQNEQTTLEKAPNFPYLREYIVGRAAKNEASVKNSDTESIMRLVEQEAKLYQDRKATKKKRGRRPKARRAKRKAAVKTTFQVWSEE